MFAYEKVKVILPKLINPEVALFMSGGVSKLIATIITYPLSTLKVNKQTMLKSKSVSTLRMVLQIYEKYGMAGYYAGLSAKIFSSVLNAATSFYINEKINSIVLNLVAI